MPETVPIDQQEALGHGAYGGGWSVATVLDISDASQKHATINRDTSILYVYSDSDVYILFDTAATTGNSTANDLILPAGLHSLSVPKGLYSGEKDGAQNPNVIHLHVKQVTSATSKKFRIVES